MASFSPLFSNLCDLPESSFPGRPRWAPPGYLGSKYLADVFVDSHFFPSLRYCFLTPIWNTDYTMTRAICQGNIKPWLRFLKKSYDTSLSGREPADYRTKRKNLSSGHRNFCATLARAVARERGERRKGGAGGKLGSFCTLGVRARFVWNRLRRW